MSDLKSMKDIMKNMQKHHGDAGLFSASDEIIVEVEAISTGSYLVDDCLGVGGIPRGRFIQFAGAESSGKTLLSLSTMAQWQKQDPKNWGIFIDAEYTFDRDWAEGLGVDLDRLYVLKENSGVKIFEFLVGKPHKELGKPKVKPGVLDQAIASPGNGLGLIILDSIAAMIPPIEAIADVGKQNMAVMGRFLPAELRKLTPLLADANVAMIGINQVRINPGQMYGNPEQSSGGSALKHACSQMVHLGKRSGKESWIMSGETEIGCTVGVKIDKNKVAPPHKKAEFQIEYLIGVTNKHLEILQLGVKYGVITRPNNRTYEYEGQKYTSKENVESWLMDEEVQEKVYEKIKAARALNPNGVAKDDVEENTEE